MTERKQEQCKEPLNLINRDVEIKYILCGNSSKCNKRGLNIQDSRVRNSIFVHSFILRKGILTFVSSSI